MRISLITCAKGVYEVVQRKIKYIVFTCMYLIKESRSNT